MFIHVPKLVQIVCCQDPFHHLLFIASLFSPSLEETMSTPLAPVLLWDGIPVRHPKRSGKEARVPRVKERNTLDDVPILGIRDVVWFVRWQGQALLHVQGILGVHQEGTHPDIDVFAQVFFVAIVHPDCRQPCPAPESKTRPRFGELAREQAPKLGADELGMHVPGQEIRSRESVPLLTKAHIVFSAANGTDFS